MFTTISTNHDLKRNLGDSCRHITYRDIVICQRIRQCSKQSGDEKEFSSFHIK